jgi:hypothetical protein
MSTKNWTGTASVPRWYGVAAALFLGTRAVTTLAAGASFAVPGDGWRSLFQPARGPQGPPSRRSS